MKHLFLAFVLLLTNACSILGGFDEGVDAYNRGDYATAYKEFLPLAEQGHASAQNNLGIMYAKGDGVPQDYVRARMWHNLAAARGYNKAEENRDLLAKEMTPAQIAEAQKLAREWEARHGKQ